MKVKEESENPGLELNIQKMKIMASGPITSWQMDGETMETVTDFIFLIFKKFLNKNLKTQSIQNDIILLRRKVKSSTVFIFHSLISFHKPVLSQLSEKAMAPHSSTLAWKIPWMEEPGGLQSLGS